MKKKFATIAAVSLLSIGVADTALADSAKDPMVKCYGIAKAGSNDCADAKGTHGCAGHSKTDYDPCEWKVISKSECKTGVKDGDKKIQGLEKPKLCKKKTK